MKLLERSENTVYSYVGVPIGCAIAKREKALRGEQFPRNSRVDSSSQKIPGLKTPFVSGDRIRTDLGAGDISFLCQKKHALRHLLLPLNTFTINTDWTST